MKNKPKKRKNYKMYLHCILHCSVCYINYKLELIKNKNKNLKTKNCIIVGNPPYSNT